MPDDIIKLLRGGVKVLTGGDSPQAQATGCNSLTDGIVRMGEVVYHAFFCDIRIQDASEINFEAFLYVRIQKKHCIKFQALHRRQKQGGVHCKNRNLYHFILYFVCCCKIPVAVFVPELFGYSDFRTSRAYRRVFDGTDLGGTCNFLQVFIETSSYRYVFCG